MKHSETQKMKKDMFFSVQNLVMEKNDVLDLNGLFKNYKEELLLNTEYWNKVTESYWVRIIIDFCSLESSEVHVFTAPRCGSIIAPKRISLDKDVLNKIKGYKEKSEAKVKKERKKREKKEVPEEKISKEKNFTNYTNVVVDHDDDEEENLYFRDSENREYIGKCVYLNDIPSNFIEVEEKKEKEEYRKLFLKSEIKLSILYKTRTEPPQYIVETILGEFYHFTLNM